MSIANYAELQSAIKNYVVKSTIPDDRVRDFIAQTETRINNLLRTSKMEMRSTANTVQGENYIVVPRPEGGTADDFGGLRYLQTTGDNGVSLEPVAPQFMNKLTRQLGFPRRFAVIDGEIRLHPVPDGEYELEAGFYRRVSALSDTNTTNWLLDGYHMIYLSGGVERAWRFVGGPEAFGYAAEWRNEFNNEVMELQAADRGDRWHAPRASTHDYPTDVGYTP